MVSVLHFYRPGVNQAPMYKELPGGPGLSRRGVLCLLSMNGFCLIFFKKMIRRLTQKPKAGLKTKFHLDIRHGRSRHLTFFMSGHPLPICHLYPPWDNLLMDNC